MSRAGSDWSTPAHLTRAGVAVAVLAVQALLLALFLVDWKVPVALVPMIVAVVVLLDRPLWAVGGMLAARLLSTGTMSFMSVGGVQIGLFEPVLLLCLGALLLRAVFEQRALWFDFPWKWPYLALVAWSVVGLAWCTRLSDGVKDVIGLFVVMATCLVVVVFVDRWEKITFALWVWVATCVAIGVLAIFGDALGLTDFSGMWKASSAGGRETGLGQQPNWFAMNLSFVLHAAAAFALVQKRALPRWGLLAATAFIFLSMMSSGSRGGAYSAVIGGVIVAMGQPLFRRWFAGFAALGVGVFVVAATADLGDLGRGLNRISANLDVLFARDIRGMNWAACIGMFLETWGRGIGPGGYADNLQRYSDWLYHSVYKYPHGIFWEQLAHGGVVGVALLVTLVVVIARMAAETIRDCKGTEAEVLAWAMPASMAGYFCWSFVEFRIDEKPFWEWLALYTALHLVAKRARAGGGPPLPPWSLKLG